MPLKYAEYAGKNRFSKYLNDYEYWPNFKIDLDEEIGNILKNGFYRVYILNSIRNAKVFFSKLYKTVPNGSNITNGHSLCEDNNQFETFSKCVSTFLAEIFFNLKIITRIEFVSPWAFEPYQNHKNPPRETLSNIDQSC